MSSTELCVLLLALYAEQAANRWPTLAERRKVDPYLHREAARCEVDIAAAVKRRNTLLLGLALADYLVLCAMAEKATT